MAQRVEPRDSLDHFPTPPWATRALCEWLLAQGYDLPRLRAWEPACGCGAMVRPLREYFAEVRASDVADYGWRHEVADFLADLSVADSATLSPTVWPGADFIITNPPFTSGEDFAKRAVERAKIGAAMLVRTVFLESVGRHRNLFSKTPPSHVLIFSERVPMVKGRLERTASTATSYSWLLWLHDAAGQGTRLEWIPPCRKDLDRPSDWEGGR